MARLIVVEGPDKVGKDTQSRLLVERLSSMGLNVIRVEPTKESHPRGKKLSYSMLASGAAKRRPNLFQFVQFINRMYFQLFKLPSFMKQYDVVILDRWALSGYVYGKCEGINWALNSLMYACAKKANIVLVLNGHSYRREAVDDSYEKDADLQERVRKEYRAACNERPNHVSIDNKWSITEVNDDIFDVLWSRKVIR